MDACDFLASTWDVANRWRTGFLDDSSEWGISREFPRPRGVSAAPPASTRSRSPPRDSPGLTLRLYHPAARQWSLYWLMDLTRRT
jgi:hypothetical protein